MSDHIENSSEDGANAGISRRSALKTGAAAIGAAAFATPVVMGVFSSRASAGVPVGCDPSVDSDALDLLKGKPRKWNTNCSDNEQYGRYNAQRTEATLEGTGGLVAAINFGFFGTDNFPMECSFYWFDIPEGWECTATFDVGDSNEVGECPNPAQQFEADSTPGACNEWDGVDQSFGADLAAFFAGKDPANGPFPVPYCGEIDELPSGGYCVSQLFLWLIQWDCCPTSV